MKVEVFNILHKSFRSSLSLGFSKMEYSVLLKEIYKFPDNYFYYFARDNFMEDDILEILDDIIEAELITKSNEKEAKTEGVGKLQFFIPGASEEIFADSKIVEAIEMFNPDTVNNLFVIIVGIEPYCLIELLRQYNIPYDELCEYIRKLNSKTEDLTPENLIPESLEGIINVIKVEKGKPQQILGREKEVAKLWQILSKKTKSNAVLVGEPGVGKSAIAELMAYEIINHKAPKHFEDFKVIELNMNDLIAGTSYRGEAEERFQYIKEFLADNQDVILFIDEIHNMLGAGSCEGNTMDFANAMKPLLASDNVKVVGATTPNEYRWFAQDSALARRFEMVEIREPRTDEVYEMILGKVKSLKEYHNVRINKKLIEHCILQASCFFNNISNPDRSLDFIDKVMANAKIRGAKVASIKDVNGVLLENYTKYNNMPIEMKKATAYHEAGHAIVIALSTLSLTVDVTAISIIPTADYLGVTVQEKKKICSWYNDSIQYGVDYIASLLGGRIAERIYTKSISAGASSDLAEANQAARLAVTKFALCKNSGNRTFSHEDLLSEKNNNYIDGEIRKILKAGEERAESLISKNINLLNELVEKLLKKGILNKEEVQSILLKNKTKV